MKILTVSDKVEQSFLKENFLRKKCQGINLILACGDLPPYYLEYLVNSLNVPLYYVPGNHDDIYLQSPSANDLSVKGCKNIDQKLITFNDLIIGGLAGAFQYKKGKYVYTEAQMHRKVLSMAPHLLVKKIKYKRAIDILITHAPPLGINDEKDLAHLGFKEFLAFMKKYSPAYLIHGHTNRHGGEGEKISSYHSTWVINTNPYRVLEIDDANLRRHHN
ncbi:MAG: metallophosphoesterase family protein [Thermodesulfobacteriota bacterium]